MEALHLTNVSYGQRINMSRFKLLSTLCDLPTIATRVNIKYPAVQFRYLADFLLQCIPDYHKSIRRRNDYSGFKM